MDQQRAYELADRWRKGILTEEEMAEFNLYYNSKAKDGGAILPDGFAADEESHKLRIWTSVKEKARTDASHVVSHPGRRYKWQRIAVAASLLLLLGTGAYLAFQSRLPQTIISGQKSAAAEIEPGKSGAILTLDDGSHIVLDNHDEGIVAQQSGVNAVIKNGQLTYQTASSALAGKGETMYNTMSTLRGRQFQMLLPDGTKVWLNAASSIRYPIAFVGAERSVEVTGEAYFEVAKDKSKPFRVHFPSSATGKQGTVEALGTGFNVSAYNDDPAAKITLLEGSVLVTPSPFKKRNEVLTPGLQAAMLYSKAESADLTIQKVDTERVIAWKNGILNLHNMGLVEVMKQLSRWYNIDIEYGDNVPDITFWGEMSRTENLSTVLNFMAESGVNFKIEDGGKKIVVRK